MLRGFIKPLGIVLCGILCIHLSATAAETDTKKAATEKKTAKKESKKETKQPETSSDKSTQSAVQAETSSVKQEDDSKKVVATVNGENISQKDVNQMLSRIGNQIPEEQIPAFTKQILDILINQKLILQFVCDNKGISQTDIDAELNKVQEDIKANPSLEGQTMEQVLETHGMSIDDLKNEITMFLSIKYMNNYLSKDIDDQKIKEHFEQNKATYTEPEVRASHILVNTQKLKTDVELAQAQEKIRKIRAELESGKDFAEATKQYSDCPSKETGGDLGFFKRKGQMVETFAAAAFSLKVGQLSDPVKTPFGYHIIKVMEIKTPTFDDVKQNIKQNMIEEKGQNLVKQLKEKAKIDIKT